MQTALKTFTDSSSLITKITTEEGNNSKVSWAKVRNLKSDELRSLFTERFRQNLFHIDGG